MATLGRRRKPLLDRRSRLLVGFGALLVLGMTTLVLQMVPSMNRSLEARKQQEVANALRTHLNALADDEFGGNEVSGEDRLHLSLLHETCVRDSDASLPWTFGRPGHQLPNATASNPEVLTHKEDPDMLAKLRQCPDVDIFLPVGIRGNGYCEDAVAYVKYLKSRLLLQWTLEVRLFDPALGRTVDYFDLCPKTPVIFFNHYWDGVPSMPRWPKDKPIYVMPNIEMYEMTAEHYWNASAVLCKTKVCYDRVTKWYEQEGSPRDTKVFYTKHTSSDQTDFARKRLGEGAIAPKDFLDVKFLHTAGTSNLKGTRQLVQCWVSEPSLPPLDVYIDKGAFDASVNGDLKKSMQHSRSPLHVNVGMVERSVFAKMTAEAAFFMCPSLSEGYGHYINQARAAGAVVITTDLPPMNELISSGTTGFLIPVKRLKDTNQILGGEYDKEHGLKGFDGLVGSFSGTDVCKAVREMVGSTTADQRALIGARARQAYNADTMFFASAMKEVQEFARRGLYVNRRP